jgi:hypothetical protein
MACMAYIHDEKSGPETSHAACAVYIYDEKSCSMEFLYSLYKARISYIYIACGLFKGTTLSLA